MLNFYWFCFVVHHLLTAKDNSSSNTTLSFLQVVWWLVIPSPCLDRLTCLMLVHTLAPTAVAWVPCRLSGWCTLRTLMSNCWTSLQMEFIHHFPNQVCVCVGGSGCLWVVIGGCGSGCSWKKIAYKDYFRAVYHLSNLFAQLIKRLRGVHPGRP